MERRLGGPQSQSGHGGEEKNSQLLPRLEPTDHPVCCPEFKRDFREIGWEGVAWMHVAQDRDKWRTFVNTVMNLRVPKKTN
jgi:hypothetical protein